MPEAEHDEHVHTVVIADTTIGISNPSSGEWTLTMEGVEVDRSTGPGDVTLRATLPDASEVVVDLSANDSGGQRLAVTHRGHEFAVFNL